MGLIEGYKKVTDAMSLLDPRDWPAAMASAAYSAKTDDNIFEGATKGAKASSGTRAALALAIFGNPAIASALGVPSGNGSASTKTTGDIDVAKTNKTSKGGGGGDSFLQDLLIELAPELANMGIDLFGSVAEGDLAEQLAAQQEREAKMSRAELAKARRESKRRFEKEFGLRLEDFADAMKSRGLNRELSKKADVRAEKASAENLLASKQARGRAGRDEAQGRRVANLQYLDQLNKSNMRRRMRGINLSPTKNKPSAATQQIGAYQPQGVT